MCSICQAMRPYQETCDYEGLSELSQANGGPNLHATTIENSGDAPDSFFTPYGVLAGDEFQGFIGSVFFNDGNPFNDFYDADVVLTYLQVGVTYEIELDADAWGDARVQIYDLYGNLVQAGGAVGGTTITFNPTNYSGGYYLRVSDYSDPNVNVFETYEQWFYTLSVNVQSGQPDALQKYTNNQIAKQLTHDGWAFFGRDGGEHWDKTKGDTITYDFSGIENAKVKKLFQWAFDAWTDVTGIKFQKVTGNADITINDDDSGAYANATVKSNGTLKDGIINISKDWDDQNGRSIDSYTFQTLIHEIGHVLGLAHAGNYNAGTGGPTTYPESVSYKNDSWQATIMSYINQSQNTSVKADYALLMTPMIADLIAIQNIYGKVKTSHLGDTVYGVNSNVGGYLGKVFKFLSGGTDQWIKGVEPVAFTILDDGGKDTLNFSSDPFKQKINLNPETYSDAFGVKGNVGIARGTIIENVIAGTGNDVVKGNKVGNVIKGNKGNDNIKGANGNDKLEGGAGKDRLDGQKGNDKLKGGNGGDKFVFAKNYDKDQALDFKNNADTLVLNDNLWNGNLSAKQAIRQFGEIQNGNAVLDFGGGDVFTVNNVNKLSQLFDDTQIV